MIAKDQNINHIVKFTESLPMKYWYDDLVHLYYSDHFDSLSSKELDKEFQKDIKTLTNTLSKLTKEERDAFINVFSKVIEFYLDHKIEKEIDSSFFNVLNLK